LEVALQKLQLPGRGLWQKAQVPWDLWKLVFRSFKLQNGVNEGFQRKDEKKKLDLPWWVLKVCCRKAVRRFLIC